MPAYATYIGVIWLRYGRPARLQRDARDALLDRFMPEYDVVDRHHVGVAAPATVTLDVAKTVELTSLPLVRAIFKRHELIMGATPDARLRPKGLLAETMALGWWWVVLAEIPDREIVVGAVTMPWEADVTFRSVPSGVAFP